MSAAVVGLWGSDLWDRYDGVVAHVNRGTEELGGGWVPEIYIAMHSQSSHTPNYSGMQSMWGRGARWRGSMLEPCESWSPGDTIFLSVDGSGDGNVRHEICQTFYTAGFSGLRLYIVNFTEFQILHWRRQWRQWQISPLGNFLCEVWDSSSVVYRKYVYIFCIHTGDSDYFVEEREGQNPKI